MHLSHLPFSSLPSDPPQLQAIFLFSCSILLLINSYISEPSAMFLSTILYSNSKTIWNDHYNHCPFEEKSFVTDQSIDVAHSNTNIMKTTHFSFLNSQKLTWPTFYSIHNKINVSTAQLQHRQWHHYNFLYGLAFLPPELRQRLNKTHLVFYNALSLGTQVFNLITMKIMSIIFCYKWNFMHDIT